MRPISFIIAGSGWRTMFFVRIAKQFPELFELKYVLCRRQERADELNRQGIRATCSEAECEASAPDFVVTAVSKPVLFETTMHWAMKGYPVLCETPAGCSPEELMQLWELSKSGRIRLQTAEQYHRYPILAAGLQAITDGLIGEPYAVRLSLAHDYHGASMIRRMLQEQPQTVSICAWKDVFEVMETDSRYGAVTDGSIMPRERVTARIVFPSGKIAWYDFSGVQYHSFIRTRHINVQGPRGEWNDTIVRYTDETNRPRQLQLVPVRSKGSQPLWTEKLEQQSRCWSPFINMDHDQDEFAIAAMLLDMRQFIESGTEIYPLAEALEDAYLWLMLKKALQNPGQTIQTERMPWHI